MTQVHDLPRARMGELGIVQYSCWLVRDSGAAFTFETSMNSELIETIFKKFALKMVELSCIKGLANNCQIKTTL